MDLSRHLSKEAPSRVTSRVLPLPEFQRPAFLDSLIFPANITQLDSGSLSGLIGKFSLAYAYACSLRAGADVDLMAAELREQVSRAQLYRERPALISSLERHKRDAILEMEPAIIAAKTAAVEARQKREYAWHMIQAYEKLLNALNRELTRKLTLRNEDYSDPDGIRTRAANPFNQGKLGR